MYRSTNIATLVKQKAIDHRHRCGRILLRLLETVWDWYLLIPVGILCGAAAPAGTPGTAGTEAQMAGHVTAAVVVLAFPYSPEFSHHLVHTIHSYFDATYELPAITKIT
jgi:hypothetical protein